MSKLTLAKLENFTAFASLNEEFSTGVNVIIRCQRYRENTFTQGIVCSMRGDHWRRQRQGVCEKVARSLSPYEGRMTRLIRRQQGLPTANIMVRRDDGNSIKAAIDDRKSRTLRTFG